LFHEFAKFVKSVYGEGEKVRPSNAQDRNLHRANDSVAVRTQLTAIRVRAGNQQIRIRLLGSLAQHFGHISAANEYIRLDACRLLER